MIHANLKQQLDYLKVAGAMRDKTHWEQKVLEPAIAARWQAEAGMHGARAVAQVAWQAAQPEPRPAAVLGTYGADDAFPATLHDELAAGFARLHAAQPVEVGARDWHPGSHQQVLDLVHPALYAVERRAQSLPSQTVRVVCVALLC